MKKIFILSIVICNYCIAYSQNVGIGTSTPTTKLHIKGSADTSQLTIDANATQSNNHPLIRLRNAAGQDLLHIHSDDATNIFIGLSAGKNNNAIGGGTYNTFMGMNTGYSNTIGNANTANGYKSLYYNTTGNFNTAQGLYSLYYNTTGSSNTANGTAALQDNTTGNYNTANGVESLSFNTTGNGNTANGYQSLLSNKTGSGNTANGYHSLFYNTTGSNNTANGINSLLSNTTGSYNTTNGYYSLYSNTTGNYNTANGHQSLYSNATGYNNTANGYYALYSNLTGHDNNANGYYALNANTAGFYNTASGIGGLYLNTIGSYNTAGGSYALYSNTSGYFNTALGYNADVSTGTLVNATAIGYNSLVNTSNKIRLGNASVTVIEGQVAYSYPSDGRFKTNISETVKGLDFIMKLRPVVYNFQTKKYEDFIKGETKKEAKITPSIDYSQSEQIRHNGFIAQEVEKAAKESGYEFDGVVIPKNDKEAYGVSYSQFVVPLVKAVQELNANNKEQEQMIEGLKTANETLKNETVIQKNINADLQKQIDELKTLIKK